MFSSVAADLGLTDAVTAVIIFDSASDAAVIASRFRCSHCETLVLVTVCK